MKQHEEEIAEVELKLKQESAPKVKYSTQVLSMRTHLRNLIKTREYKEADHAKQDLEKKEHEEDERWQLNFESKKRSRVDLVKKKQEAELKALRVKL